MVDTKGIATDSLYTALFELCVQSEKAYYQGQTQIGNRHVNCLERFLLPRGNVTIVLTTYKIYLRKCFRKFNTLRVRGAT